VNIRRLRKFNASSTSSDNTSSASVITPASGQSMSIIV